MSFRAAPRQPPGPAPPPRAPRYCASPRPAASGGRGSADPRPHLGRPLDLRHPSAHLPPAQRQAALVPLRGHPRLGLSAERHLAVVARSPREARVQQLAQQRLVNDQIDE